MKTLTLGSIVAYFFGACIFVGALQNLFQGELFVAFIGFVLGTFIFPPASRLFEKKTGFRMSFGVKCVAVIVLVAIWGRTNTASSSKESAHTESNASRATSSSSACGWYLHYDDGSGECECADETPAQLLKEGARILSQKMGADKNLTKVNLAKPTQFRGMLVDLKMFYFREEKECRASLEKILAKQRKDEAAEKKREEAQDKQLAPYN